MSSSLSDRPKKRGRPPTGRDPYVGFRSPEDLSAAIDAWAKDQDPAPSRSKAIRIILGSWLTDSGYLHRASEVHKTKPSGPATEAVKAMDEAIKTHRSKKKAAKN